MTDEQKKQQKRDADQRKADAQAVMATRAGRAVIWRLFERCGVMRRTDNLMPEQLQYMAGRRDAALELMDLVVVMPEYRIMVNENAKEAE